jgi:hypothetical protein
MTQTLSDDMPDVITELPARCQDGYRLVPRGKARKLAIEQALMMPDPARSADAVWLGGDLTVEAGEHRLLVARGSAVVKLFRCEGQRLLQGLADRPAGAHRPLGVVREPGRCPFVLLAPFLGFEHLRCPRSGFAGERVRLLLTPLLPIETR